MQIRKKNGKKFTLGAIFLRICCIVISNRWQSDVGYIIVCGLERLLRQADSVKQAKVLGVNVRTMEDWSKRSV